MFQVGFTKNRELAIILGFSVMLANQYVRMNPAFFAYSVYI